MTLAAGGTQPLFRMGLCSGCGDMTTDAVPTPHVPPAVRRRKVLIALAVTQWAMMGVAGRDYFVTLARIHNWHTARRTALLWRLVARPVAHQQAWSPVAP